jgi:hypothetical protein
MVRPDRSILVNGRACETWDEVLDACCDTPADEPLEVANILKIVGGG